ncbi:MAG: BatA domain-containing protein [Candidatus Eisenbacteria bacterium]|nr:BatA domain-containing protein [Candidatus Eisenbacteria bacterium]
MFDFFNIAFLGGLAAAALPILIHLFSKKKAQDVPFSSIEYLREISIKKVRRMRLRQFLLLALRVLIIASFALAMSRPIMKGSAGSVTRGTSTVAILLDNSYSMGAFDPAVSGGSVPESGVAGGGDGTLFAEAKSRALEVLDLMKDGDQGILAFTSRPVEMPFQTPVANLGLLRQEVERSRLAYTPSDMRSGLEQVLAMLEDARTLNKELFVVSDFQQADLEEWAAIWNESESGPDLGVLLDILARPARAQSSDGPSETPPSGGAGSGNAGAADGVGSGGGTDATGSGGSSGAVRNQGDLKLPEGLSVYLVPVRDVRQENLSIASLHFDPSGGFAGKGRVTVSIKNQGADAVSGRVVRLLEAGDIPTPLADREFDVAPLAETEVELDLPEASESGVLEVRLGADFLEEDNRAYLVTANPGTKEVLLVRGSIGSRGNEASAFASTTGLVQDDGLYIEHALDPTGDGRYHKVVEVGPDALVDPANLTVDVVVLSDVGRLSPAAVENLERFRQRGGGIFIALGDRVDLRYYNSQILGRIAPSIELLNVMTEPGEGTYRSLRPAAAGHPAFRGFPVSPGDDLSSAKFQRIVESQAREGARVVAHFGSEVPALVEDDGVILFSSSLDGTWNDFVTSASFLPMMHLTLDYLASRAEGERGPRTVGDPLEAMVESGSYQVPVQLVDPEGGRLPLDPVQQGAVDRFRTETTTLPGVYQLVDAGGEVLSRFAVNVDPEEGDLSVAPTDRLQRLFGRGAQVLGVGQPISRELLEGRYGRELWRPLLMMVLLLLAVETFLARGRFLS